MPETPLASPFARRNPAGWVVLFAILMLMVVNALSSYFARAREKPDPARFEVQLRWTLVMDRLNKNLHLELPMRAFDSALRTTINEIRNDTTDTGTGLRAIYDYELYGQVTPRNLSVLSRADTNVNRLLAQIYQSKTLSGKTARHLERELAATEKGGSLSYRLAGQHALSKAGMERDRTELVSDSEAFFVAAMMIAVVLICLVGCGLWLLYFARRQKGEWAPLGFRADLDDPIQVDRLVTFAGLALMLFVMASEFLRALGDTGLLPWHATATRTSMPLNLIHGLMVVALIFLLTKLPLLGERVSLRRLGFQRSAFGKHLLWGIGGAAANYPLVLGTGWIGSVVFKNYPPAEHPVTQILGQQGSFWGLASIFILASVTAPLIEETIFRGCLAPAFSRAFGGLVLGIAVSSMFFALMHSTGLPAYLPLAMTGATAAMLSYQTRSLVPSIVMHATHNALTLLIALAFY